MDPDYMPLTWVGRLLGQAVETVVVGVCFFVYIAYDLAFNGGRNMMR
jgi:hypothetical protein